VVQHDADGSKASEGLHYFHAREIIIKLIFLTEFIGSSPEKKHDKKISDYLINDRTYECSANEFSHNTPHIAKLAVLIVAQT
jgi:hypothetical protein